MCTTPPSNTCFLVPTQVHNPSSMSIGSAVFAGLTIVTDWRTDHATLSVTTGRIYRYVLWCGLITSGQTNLTQGRIAAADGRFSRIRHVAPVCPSMRTHWRHLANLCFLRPTRVHNPNGKSIGSAVFAQLTAESLYTSQWMPLSPKNCPLPWGIWTI